MRPLNRPMFKMGGPVKEGIMDGIREPKADGGTIGGGVIQGQPMGTSTGFYGPVLTSIGATGLAALRASPKFFKDIGKSIFTKPGAAGIATPTKPSFFSLQGLRNIFPTQRFRTLKPTVSRTTERVKDAVGSYSPIKFSSRQLSFKEAFKDPKIIGQAIRENPLLALSTPTLLTNTLTTGGPIAGEALKGFANFIVPGERFDPFKPEKPETIVKESNVGKVGKKGDDAITPKDKETPNQFN